MAFTAQVGKCDLVVLVGTAGHEHDASVICLTRTGIRDNKPEPTGVKLAQFIRIKCRDTNVAKTALWKRHCDYLQ
ncbi:hypothetical protein D3C75_1034250 [compost metagenome]